MSLDDRSYLYDAAGEAQGRREKEVASIVERVMDDVDRIMETIEGDEDDILREIVGALIAAPSHADGGIQAYDVLLRRARHYAEGCVE